MMIVRGAWLALLACAALMLCACAGGGATNPSFAISEREARAELARMRADRAPAQRAVVVIGGLFDPGLESSSLAARLRRLLDPSSTIVAITPFGTSTMDELRRRVIDRVDAELGAGDDPAQTIDVDVVGFSLGGVAGLDAARPRQGERRLAVRRLFAIASPLRGADAARGRTLDERVLAIRPGSDFLTDLARHDDASIEVWSYVRMGDGIVGAQNAGWRGQPPHWLSDLAFSWAHADAAKDPRILADIARRLRGEDAYATIPPADLPDAEPATSRRREPLPAGSP